MRAHSDDIAWRVVTRLLWFGQPIRQVCDKRLGLGVSRHYVLDVLDRFHATGDVATHQGKGADPLTHNTLTRAEDCQIVQQMLAAPRVTLKEQCAQFVLDSGVIIPYRAFCKAVHRLRFTRKKIHTVAYQCDMERANAWLAELLTFHSVGELGVLDETSKDVDVVKSGFGYSLRGVKCSAQDMYLSHDNLRVSALCLYTVQDGFLDWAFTSGMYNKDYFLHVTTENFRDWRGVLRRPMLVRGKHEPEAIATPAARPSLTARCLPRVRSSTMCGPRSASAAAFCSTTPRSTTRTSSWRAWWAHVQSCVTSHPTATTSRRWITVRLASSCCSCGGATTGCCRSASRKP
jgi:transposase